MNLKVLSSGPLKGHTLKINAQGLVDSLRTQKDGFVYFGCKKSGTKQHEIINDFVIPSKDKETEKRHRGRHL